MNTMKYSEKNMPKNKREKLEGMKKKVRRAMDHDSENYSYFNWMKKFICDTTLDDETRSKLNLLKKPEIECNEIEQFINTLLGEFKDFEPAVKVTPCSNAYDEQTKNKLTQQAEIIEGFIRYKLSNVETDSATYEIFADILRGGLSAATVYVDWRKDDKYEFDVDIFLRKEPYPTMCGWDPTAVESHKGDGRYCYRIFAYTKDQAEERYGEDAIADIAPQGAIEGFSWSYYQDDEPYYIFCEYYEEERKKVKIVLLSYPFPKVILDRIQKYNPSKDGLKMTMAAYKAALDEWEVEGYLEVPPIVIQEKMGEDVKICQYIFNENKIIEYSDTDYKYLPIIRFQGGAVKLEDNLGSNKREICRSFVHNLVGIQMLKNTAAQGVAYEIENTVAHKWVMEYETVIPQQKAALLSNQIPSVLLWQSKPKRGDSGSEAYPGPQPVVRPAVPEIITQTFYETSIAMRRMMGTMESNNVPQGNIAGGTLQMAYSQESRASYPWRQGLDAGLNRMGTIFTELMSKVFTTPMSISVITRDGKNQPVSINQPNDPNSVMMDFDAKQFNIEISAGVNAEILKQAGMNQLMEFSRTFKGFNEFIDQECKPELIENMDIKNKGAMVMKVQDWDKKQQQRQAQMAQNMPLDPVKAQLQIATMQEQGKDKDRQLKAAEISGKLQNDNRKTDMTLIETLSKVEDTKMSTAVRQQEADAKNLHSTVSLVSSLAKQKADTRQFHHQMAHEHRMKDKDHEHALEIAEKTKPIEVIDEEL